MRYLLSLIFILILYHGYSQCSNFHRTQCELPSDWNYEYNSQSLDAELYEGQTIKVKIILYSGFDYYIGFCKSEGLSGISYEFINQNNEVIANKENATINDKIEFIEISTVETLMIAVVIKTMNSSAMRVNINNKNCLGLIIGSKPIEN
jgi:hypothetical protein